MLAGLGPVTVTEGSLVAGLAITLRVLAIGLPGVLLLADAPTRPTWPTRWPRCCGCRTGSCWPRSPPPGCSACWPRSGRLLGLARRARGLGDDGPLGRARTVRRQVFALLVLAIRRGGVLATAMEARGFGAGGERTWARPSRLARTDWLVVLGGVLLPVVATVAGVVAAGWPR